MPLVIDIKKKKTKKKQKNSEKVYKSKRASTFEANEEKNDRILSVNNENRQYPYNKIL